MGFETHVPKHPKRYLDRALEKHKRHLELVPDKLKPLFRATFKAGIRVGVLKRVLATTNFTDPITAQAINVGGQKYVPHEVDSTGNWYDRK
jgi:hypothetical protein